MLSAGLRHFGLHTDFFLFFLPFAASTDSPAATVDSETITLNSGTLQTFEILPVSNRELLFVTVLFF